MEETNLNREVKSKQEVLNHFECLSCRQYLEHGWFDDTVSYLFYTPKKMQCISVVWGGYTFYSEPFTGKKGN